MCRSSFCEKPSAILVPRAEGICVRFLRYPHPDLFDVFINYTCENKSAPFVVIVLPKIRSLFTGDFLWLQRLSGAAVSGRQSFCFGHRGSRGRFIVGSVEE